MSAKVATKATINDLYQTSEKAELIGGEVVKLLPTGMLPSRASFAIAMSLRQHESPERVGQAYSDNTGFIVSLPIRESFSPDASWYVGTFTGMKFLEGAPLFAAEVRSENDYGAKAEQDMAAKRKDYFAAGTQVVWDVDLLNPDVVKVYRTSSPEEPTLYKRSELAEAEPAVSGWQMSVDELFR
jgi:Uma2 family endonuclease